VKLPKAPRAWAGRLTTMLDQVLGADRFPVDVSAVAQGYSAQVYPGDSIVHVDGANLPGFEGALLPVPGRKGWGIIYNQGIASRGRINFTLAHEFGHYLVHRAEHPKGIHCSTDDVSRGQTGTRDIEREADLFAADLLMPFNDFRKQITEHESPDIDAISACAVRYRVSLLAATLRWISYTQRRAVLVVSRDGFILWSRSSDAALKTRAFFRTSVGPIEIPQASLAARQDLPVDNRTGLRHPAGVWFDEEVKEMAVFSEQYDFAVSLVILGDPPDWRPTQPDDDEKPWWSKLSA